MSQNFAAGIITLIPSPNFMNELAIKYSKKIPEIALTMWSGFTDKIKHRYPNYKWEEYIEFYSEKYKKYFYYFNSFEDLKIILNKTRNEIDYRNIRNETMQFAITDRIEQLNKMKQFFQQKIGFQL